ncbi:MAG: hypothetical protein AB7T20_13875 [Steroidobacteraceae bacterium]
MRAPLRILLPWIACLPAAFAQESPAAGFFAQIAGDWQGTGEVRGMASVQQMSWQPVLDGSFLRLTFDNRMTAADGKEWRFQAHGYYRIRDDGTITGLWFDSRGVSFPLSGAVDDGGTMTIRWGTDDTERGRSSYRLTAETLEVTDEVLSGEGEWRVFGGTRLTRAP